MAKNNNVLKEWLSSANDDELTCRSVLKEKDGAPNSVCFLSQQLAEKMLKAFLVSMDIEFPKVHQLSKLINLILPAEPQAESLKNDGDGLSAFYTATRYPGDYEEYSWQDAEKAFAAAIKIKNFVLEHIVL